jgi:RNA polymerase sigma factor (sigma-70 family)
MDAEHEVGGTNERGNAAWRALVERHVPLLKRYVRLQASPHLRAREPVDDLVQSIVRELLADEPADVASLASGGDASFKSYMYAAAQHKIVSKHRYHDAAMRRAEREVHLSDSLWELPERGDGSRVASPSVCVERTEDVERLHAAIEALPDDDRRILVLRRIFDVSTAEIARELGLSESAVRWRLGSILTELASKLNRSA